MSNINPIERARIMRAEMVNTATQYDDAKALQLPEFYDKWKPDADYIAGDRRRDPEDGLLYKCLQSHTSQSDWQPSIAPSLWARVLVDPDGTPKEWKQPESTEGYEYGAIVIHNGHLWRNDFDGAGGNIWEPGVYGWTDLGEANA